MFSYDNEYLFKRAMFSMLSHFTGSCQSRLTLLAVQEPRGDPSPPWEPQEVLDCGERLAVDQVPWAFTPTWVKKGIGP